MIGGSAGSRQSRCSLGRLDFGQTQGRHGKFFEDVASDARLIDDAVLRELIRRAVSPDAQKAQDSRRLLLISNLRLDAVAQRRIRPHKAPWQAREFFSAVQNIIDHRLDHIADDVARRLLILLQGVLIEITNAVFRKRIEAQLLVKLDRHKLPILSLFHRMHGIVRRLGCIFQPVGDPRFGHGHRVEVASDEFKQPRFIESVARNVDVLRDAILMIVAEVVLQVVARRADDRRDAAELLPLIHARMLNDQGVEQRIVDARKGCDVLNEERQTLAEPK